MEIKLTTPKKPEFNFDVSVLEQNEKEILKKQERKIAATLALSVGTALLTGALRLRRKYKKSKRKK